MAVLLHSWASMGTQSSQHPFLTAGTLTHSPIWCTWCVHVSMHAQQNHFSALWK